MLDTSPLSEDQKNMKKSEKSIMIQKTNFEHEVLSEGMKRTFDLSAERQSKGTMRYYGLSAPFFNTIRKNAFLPIDEIGSSLHPLLVVHFIREFLEQSDSAQLLFTTHNMSLLNEKDILRKDAIWITEKEKDGATQLYSVADFPEFRKELSFYNYYKLGKFGGVPQFD